MVLHVNNLKQMYGKWLVSEQTRLWGAAAGTSSIKKPEAFLKFTEAWHPVVSKLASQMAIAGGDEACEGHSGRNQWKEQQKNECLSKATVNTDQGGAAVQGREPRMQRRPHDWVV